MVEKRPREFINPEARQCIDRRLYSLQESLLCGKCSDSHLSLCAKWLSQKHFMDACVERAVSSGLCGWPGCGNEIKRSKGKFEVSLRNRRIEETDKWGLYTCSDGCQVLSQAFLKSISTTSPYARDVVLAYLNENENTAVVERMSRLKVSSEPVLMEVKEHPKAAAAIVKSITSDISFSVSTPTMLHSIQMCPSMEGRGKKLRGEDNVTSMQRPESFEEDDGDGDPLVDVESDAAIWHEVIKNAMPDYLGEDTSLLDPECFSGDSYNYSNDLPCSTFIVLWNVFTGWQPLVTEGSSISNTIQQQMNSGSGGGDGLSTSKQRAEVLSSMVHQCLPEVAKILGQDKRTCEDGEHCLSRFAIDKDESRAPQIQRVAQDRLATLVSCFSMSSEIPDLNQDQWHLVTWVLLCAVHAPWLMQSEGILGSIALKHIESLGVSREEFFVLVRVEKDLVTTWEG